MVLASTPRIFAAALASSRSSAVRLTVTGEFTTAALARAGFPGIPIVAAEEAAGGLAA